MAKNAGIDMMPVHLFPTKNSPCYFACKRFDIKGSERFHTHTVSGLLQTLILGFLLLIIKIYSSFNFFSDPGYERN